MSATSDTSQFYTVYGYSYFGHCDLKFLIDSLICDRSNVDEEAMLAILAYATGPDVLKYIHKYLEMDLQNLGAYHV
jgi:hypothetical protein